MHLHPFPSLLRTLLVALALLCTSCRDAVDDVDEPEVWRFAIEEAEGSVQHRYALKFKELIEERTDGAVKVVIYPYGALGTSTQTTEQLNLGVLQFAMASPGTVGKFIPELQVFLLHFLLPEDDVVLAKVLRDEPFRQKFDQLYAEKGLQLLSIFSEGEMAWTTDREIRSPEDFNGMKFRVMTTPLLLASYDAYGASATPMPYSEVYSGLQLNMIDGQVNPVFAIDRQKFYEVSSWMIFPRHAHFITTMAANREFMESLPESRRKIIQETVEQLEPYIYETQHRYQYERLKDILRKLKKKRSMYHISGDLTSFLEYLTESEREELIEQNEWLEVSPPLTEQERAKFEQLSREVRERFKKMAGPRGAVMLDQIEATIERIEGD